MSLDWNLSSEDELEGDDEDEDGYIFSLGSDDIDKPTSATRHTFTNEESDTVDRGFKDDMDDDDDDDDDMDAEGETRKELSLAALPVDVEDEYDSEDDENIEWEDASDEDGDDGGAGDNLDQKPSAKLKAVTIDLNEDTTKSSPKKGKKRSRRVFRNKSLPQDLRAFLKDLHQTHLLALAARAIQISKCCSNPTLLHTAYSLIPEQHTTHHQNNKQHLPTVQQLQTFCQWYFPFVNRVDQRRRAQIRANTAAGAPRRHRRRSHQRRQPQDPRSGMKKPRGMLYRPLPKLSGNGQTTPFALLQICHYLSPTEDPQLNRDVELCMTSMDKTQILVTMARSMGWRARYVVVLDGVGQDLDVHHPVFLMGVTNIFSAIRRDKKIKIEEDHVYESEVRSSDHNTGTFAWVEILCDTGKKRKWVHIDPADELIDRPRLVEAQYYCHKSNGTTINPKRLQTIPYVLGIEHLEGESILLRATDVTPRYANSWSKSLKERGLAGVATNEFNKSWWPQTIHQMNKHGGTATRKEKRSTKTGARKEEAIEIDEESIGDAAELNGEEKEEEEEEEKRELEESATRETMPTSKAGFKNHPAFALSSQLNMYEVLAPDAKKRMCGMFKGELVYGRSDVSVAMVAKKWLYQGRKVMEGQKPIKRVKKRRKPTPKGFRQLDSYGVGESNDGSEEARKRQIEEASVPDSDGKEDLFAIWQTEAWAPDYVGPNDEIPVNEYKNIELELMNPGLQHLDQPRMAKVAKKLGIPYAPCLLGFEGHGGNRTPTIRGIVVHEHNADMLEAAYSEFESHAVEQEQEAHQAKILRRWKKLITGALIKERVDREYGGDK